MDTIDLKPGSSVKGIIKRSRVLIKGIVQGVGFRPFLYRSAQAYNLLGFVKNTSQGVILEVEGNENDIAGFIEHVRLHPPPLALIESCESSEIPILHSTIFEILSSEENGEGSRRQLLVSPDIAICDNCISELFQSEDRRFRYPFINCTDCGPRFSIIQDLPYDRPKTTMKDFAMCDRCEEEYKDPFNRRYHAQPISCYRCGPTLSFYETHNTGKKISPRKINTDDPVGKAAQKIKEGFIVAVKGLGGYHLACLASLEETVVRMRQLKGREMKPFALMGSLDMIMANGFVSDKEKALLLTPAAPIVLLKRKETATIAPSVAPGLAEIGFMLPYTPLHLALLEKIREPLVMTSANITDEPIIYKDDMKALGTLSDYILSHDREIHMFEDDSVVKVFADELYMVRRSRGYVPLPMKLPLYYRGTILALGPMLKTTFSFLYDNKVIMGQYVGDTDSPASIEAERKAIDHLMHLFSLEPSLIVIDKHPGYPNRLLVDEFKQAKVIEIQHHKAHVGALLAEKGDLGNIIGISMDGTGYGDDGNIWGGEFFVGDYRGLKRFGHLKYLFLPSGDKSAKEPWRFALSVLHALYGADPVVLEHFPESLRQKAGFLLEAIDKKAGGILTSSCGRLFDAAAALMGIGYFNSYEGELPMKLQALAEKSGMKDDGYEFAVETGNNIRLLNFMPAIRGIIEDKRSPEEKAFAFHYTLAKGFAEMARFAANDFAIRKVGLTGGVFQNTLLLKLTKDLLEAEGFTVLIHSEAPPNDGGVSLGQAFLAAGQALAGEIEKEI
ncbi:MAG: carbamoyltransferase HypF [Acidobacteria bacterium]|jgi:hydrogenase maturation protein HypF|nr:carbamoyltransferase HypF [Acidobacteriota bacterium]